MGDWSLDGRFVAYESATSGATGLDIWILPLTGDKKPFPFVQGPASDQRPIFSPDGRWIAYTSDESGVAQVYVQPFPATGGRSQVSKNGGTQPLWRGDGKELFYIAFDGTMMATPVDATRQFESGTPQALFRTDLPPTGRKQYAVSRDGQRFLMIVPRSSGANASSLPITVVTNWLGAVQK
jgi:Tol biopolymer transport system component